MRALILLSLAGLTAYTLISAGFEREWNAGEKTSTARLELLPQASPAREPLPQNPLLPQGERPLRSWGSSLQALDGEDPTSQPQSASGASRQEAIYQPVPAEAAPIIDTGASLAAPTPAPAAALPDGTHAAWAKVIYGARAHSAASISSPATKFYPQGKELQVVGRESGWFELLDPETGEHGFIFEKYLVAIDGPSPRPAVTQASAKPVLVEAATPVAVPAAQKPHFAAKPVQPWEMTSPARADDLAADGRRDRTARKEERRQRKLFRFFGRDAGPEAWTVGSPQ